MGLHVVHSQTTGCNCLLKNITKGHWFSWTSTLLARSSHHTVMIMAINILPSDYVIWKSYIAKGSCCKQNMVPPLWFHPWPMMTQVATVPSRSLALCLSLYLDPGDVQSMSAYMISVQSWITLQVKSQWVVVLNPLFNGCGAHELLIAFIASVQVTKGPIFDGLWC